MVTAYLEIVVSHMTSIFVYPIPYDKKSAI